MRKFLFPDTTSLPASIGLLLLRLIAGGAMTLHGWQKVQDGPFTWMGAAMPGILQGLATLAEFGGGIALILGLLTPVAALGLTITMAVATYTVASQGGMWVPQERGARSYESALLYLGVSLLFLVVGPGALSLDSFLLNRKKGGSIIASRHSG